MEPTLLALLDALLDQAHGTGLVKDLRDKMRDDLALQLDQRLFVAYSERLNDQQQLDLQRLLAYPTDQVGLQQLLTQAIPEYQTLFQGVFEQFKTEYLAVCQG